MRPAHTRHLRAEHSTKRAARSVSVSVRRGGVCHGQRRSARPLHDALQRESPRVVLAMAAAKTKHTFVARLPGVELIVLLIDSPGSPSGAADIPVARCGPQGDLKRVNDRLVATLLLLPLGVAVIVSTTRLARENADVPHDDDIAAAASYITEVSNDDDDAIVILPPWSMRPLAALGPRASRVTSSDGPAATLLPGRHRRVVALQEPDADPFVPTLANLGVPLSSRRFGALTVQVYDGGGPARFDLLRDWSRVSVAVNDEPCTLPVAVGEITGVACGGAGAGVRATREHALVTENGRLVARIVGVGPGRPVTLVVGDVTLGESLVVAAGHTRRGAERGCAYSVDVLVDGEPFATLQRTPSFVVEPARARLRETFVRPLQPAGEGFRAEVLDTRRFADGQHRLAFVVTNTLTPSDAKIVAELALDAFVPARGTNNDPRHVP